MKRVYQSADSARIALVRALLEEAGMTSALLNTGMGGVVGHMPVTQALPELWVAEEHEAAALQLVEQFESGPPESEPIGEAWVCPTCGEQQDGLFTRCWKCGPFDVPPDEEVMRMELDPRHDPQACCDNCGYRLWGLTDRRCPECGEDF